MNMKKILCGVIVVLGCVCAATFAQDWSIPRGIDAVTRTGWKKLPLLRDKQRSYQAVFVGYRDSNNERVIMEHFGPGCVYNIWGTRHFNGNTVTDWATNPGNIKFYFDGEAAPRINAPFLQVVGNYVGLPTLQPFAAPLCTTGGHPHERNPDGTYSGPVAPCSFLPIPFKRSLKITTTGDPSWVHVGYVTYADDEGITSWTGTEDLSEVIWTFNNVGQDPKPQTTYTVVAGTVNIPAGQRVTLLDGGGAGHIGAIKVRPSPANASVVESAEITCTWDNHTVPDVNVPLGGFFGSAAGFEVMPTRSIPVGMSTGTALWYNYFPMPFWNRAVISVRNGTGAAMSLTYEIHIGTEVYPQGRTGYFRAQANRMTTRPEVNYPFLTLSGVKGHAVGGVFGERKVSGWNHLEGDERFWVDGSRTVTWPGTGQEDYYLMCFNMFARDERGIPFQRPLFGNPGGAMDGPVLYRFHIGEMITFDESVRCTIEKGMQPCEDETQITGASVWFYYGVDEPGIELTDTFDVGKSTEEAAHRYQVVGQTWGGTLTEYYEWNDTQACCTFSLSCLSVTDDGRKWNGSSQFTVRLNPANNGARLRVRLDQRNSPGPNIRQKARVFVDGAEVGIWQSRIYAVPGPGWWTANDPGYAWKDDDFEIPGRYTAGKSSVTIRLEYLDSRSGDWSEFYYWVYSYRPIGTVGPASKLALSAMPGTVSADDLGTSTITALVQDAQGNLVTASSAVITFSISGGTGTLIGPNPVSAVAGSAKIVYRAGASSGVVTITAVSPGLTAGMVNITVSRNSPPNPPTNLLCNGVVNPVNLGDQTPDLSWTFSDPDPGDVQSAFQVLVSSSAAELGGDVGGVWDTGKVVSSANTTAYTLGMLQPGVTYYWKVRTWDVRSAIGPYSVVAQFTMAASSVPDTDPPRAVTDLRAAPGGSAGTVVLSWTAPGDDGSVGVLTGGYRIQFATSNINWNRANAQIALSTANVSPGSVQVLLVADLTPGVTYFFRLWSGDESGNWSGISNGATTYATPVMNPAPGAPMSLTVEGAVNPRNVSVANPTFGWVFNDPGDTQTAYQVLVASVAAHVAADNGSFWDSGKVVGGANSVQYAGARSLQPGVTYYWKVRTWDSMDQAGPYSAVNEFTMAQIPLNNPPSITLISPVNGSTYSAPADILLGATATDPDGTIASVRFYRGSTLLATDTASPYEYTWTNVSSGTYQLRAVAQDNRGATSTSTVVTVTVLPGDTPAVWYALTTAVNPANGGTVSPASGTYLAGSQIQVTATPNANYTFATWSEDATGTNPTITITMDADKTLTANFTYTPPVNSSPSVVITSPADGAMFTAPASITITATAADSDGSIAAVRFYSGTTLLNTDSASPYEYTWLNVAAGDYVLSAQAVDDRGAVGTSAAVLITVNPGSQPPQPVLEPGEVRVIGGQGGYINATVNPNVTIRFRRTVAGKVTVRIYDLRGRLVMEKSKDGPAGVDDDIVWNVADLPVGVYIARVKSAGINQAKRFAILR